MLGLVGRLCVLRTSELPVVPLINVLQTLELHDVAEYCELVRYMLHCDEALQVVVQVRGMLVGGGVCMLVLVCTLVAVGACMLD